MISESQQQAAIDGDSGIQDTLILELFPSVLKYVNKFSRPYNRDDMTSIALVELVRRIRCLNKVCDSLEYYILACVKHRLYDYLRRESLRRVFTLDTNTIQQNTDVDSFVDSIIFENQLSSSHAELFTLRMAGYTYDEVANITGLSRSSVYRGVQEIKTKLMGDV